MQTDDFDYPMPKRETNWTMGKDAKKPPRAPHVSNRTDDIDGAAAGTTRLYQSKKFQHKPDLYGSADIDGASPTRLCPKTVNKRNDASLNNRDIEHSFPESKLFATPRIVSPLDPVYPLPQVRHRAPTPPKMVRETMKISDIDGTKAKHQRLRTVERNPLDYSDVPLSRAGAANESRRRVTPSMALETRDITGPAGHHVLSHRRTNPLEPEYRVPGPPGAGSPFTLGPVPGAKSSGMKPMRADQPMLSLKSDDISGAKPGNHLPYPKTRREWKKTCDVSDIDIKGKRTL